MTLLERVPESPPNADPADSLKPRDPKESDAAVMETERDNIKAQSDNAYLDFALANPAAYRLMFEVSPPTCGKHFGPQQE